MMLTILLLSITAIFGDCASYYDGRIVGGQDVNIEDYPYQVSQQLFLSHSCGGSIVAEKKVLCAAHCTIDQTLEWYTIRVGSSIRDVGGEVHKVVDIRNHPLYDPRETNYDISVLTVESSLQYNGVLHSISLMAEGEDVPDGSIGTVTGWGLTGPVQGPAVHLQMLKVPKVSDEECKKVYSVMEPEMICFGYPIANMDTCSQDSGGPLVVDNKQVGVVSFGLSPCGYPAPSIYAKVSRLRDFVDSCINE